MSGVQKANNPVGAGLNANETADAPIIGQPDAIAKRETTLIAHFALVGHAVHHLGDGGFLVTRWGQSRHCPDLHALAGFARQIGAIK
jgi:hypothetical protein